jgi:hypothetical protein
MTETASNPSTSPPPTTPSEATETPKSSPPQSRPKEIGGPPGPEPTRYGDWQFNGRCTDF